MFVQLEMKHLCEGFSQKVLSVFNWRPKSFEVWEPNLHSILKCSVQEILDLVFQVHEFLNQD